MAKVYVRRKEPGKGWRYRAIPKVDRQLQIEPGVKFHVRFKDASGKFLWSQPYDTLQGLERSPLAWNRTRRRSPSA